MARSAGNSTSLSKPEPRGIIVKAPPPREYLCQHICRCRHKTVLIDRRGRPMYQRCVTTGVRNDYENGAQNVYLGEVGYDMTKTGIPPAPLMSGKDPHRPSCFPLGAATREGLLNVSKQDLEECGGSTFRIPDVIKVIQPNLPPVQSNIDLVIEIKFTGDTLREEQYRAYLRIAGNKDKFLLINEHECGCKKEPKPAPQAVPQKIPATKPAPLPLVMPSPRLREKFYPQPAPVPTHDPWLAFKATQDLSEYLPTAKEVGGVILVLGVIYLTLQTGGLAAGLLRVGGVYLAHSIEP